MFLNPRNYGFYQPRNIFYDDFNRSFHNKSRAVPKPKAQPVQQPITAKDIKIKIDAQQNILTILFRKNGKVYSECKKLPEYVKRDQTFDEIKCQLENGEVKILLPKRKTLVDRKMENLKQMDSAKKAPNLGSKFESNIGQNDKTKNKATQTTKANAEKLNQKSETGPRNSKPAPKRSSTKSTLEKINEQNEDEFILVENKQSCLLPTKVEPISEISIEDEEDSSGSLDSLDDRISNHSDDLELINVATVVE